MSTPESSSVNFRYFSINGVASSLESVLLFEVVTLWINNSLVPPTGIPQEQVRRAIGIDLWG